MYQPRSYQEMVHLNEFNENKFNDGGVGRDEGTNKGVVGTQR